MHMFLREKFRWYKKWHETWIHGPTHWVVFTSAVFVAMLLFSYASSTGGGAGVITTF